jgi:Mrp family chromosome partitioning ATPase
MDTAEQTTEFVESNTRRTMAVMIVLGVLAGAGLSYLLELRRRTFGDRLEPEAILGAPLLAEIPLFSDEGLNTRLPTRDAPRSAAAEGFRFAAASIQDSMRGAKSVMMVGATLGQGKSTTLINTTMANARRGRSVLVVDCDFGNQDATRLLLGLDKLPDIGLIDVIESGALLKSATSTVHLDDDVSLDLLSRGGRSIVAANLLSSNEARVVFESAASKYDIVFVDAPPLLQVAYASTVARYVDALVVVVSHDSPIREMEEMAKRLQLIGTPVLGYLYNRAPLRKEMTAVDGSMMDILGEAGDFVGEEPEQSWWQKIRI